MHLLVTLLLSSVFACAQEPTPGPPAAERPASGAPAPAKASEARAPARQPETDAAKAGSKPGAQAGQPGPGAGGKPEPKPDPPAPAQPLPRGTDPSDLAAMRSAEAMIDAERKLARLIKEGKIKDLDRVLPFDEIDSWPYEDGLKGMPERIGKLAGKRVLMTGFMMPIDEVQHIKEFLLVQSLWSCCYGQPPDINGLVRVVMPAGRTADYSFDPLQIIGRFEVKATMVDGYCVDIYQLHVESLEAIR